MPVTLPSKQLSRVEVFDEEYHNQCIEIGQKTGLFKDEMVVKGCTPDYLPAFIEMEVDKRKNK